LTGFDVQRSWQTAAANIADTVIDLRDLAGVASPEDVGPPKQTFAAAASLERLCASVAIFSIRAWKEYVAVANYCIRQVAYVRFLAVRSAAK